MWYSTEKKIYTLISLVIISLFIFSSCKKGEYKKENGKLYHFRYAGIGVTFKREVKGVDLKTFEQISELYGKDKNHAYLKNLLLPNSDPKSFKIINDIYSKDKNNVYYFDKIIHKADPSSFQIIANRYSKDKKHVFLNEKYLPNSDPKTFKLLANNFSKDKNNVYSSEKLIHKADPNTFESVTFYAWKDKNHVFHFESIIPNADPKTIKRAFKKDDDDCWLVDKNAVYHLGERINVAPKDFEILSHQWGRSKTNYYFTHIPLKDLDYATAKILTNKENPNELTSYIKDKNNVFWGNKKIEGADPKTFVVEAIHWHAHDSKHKYEAEKIVK